MVDGARTRRAAISRTESPAPMPREISSRSTSDSRSLDRSFSRLDTADHIEQSLHGLGRAAHGTCSLLERLADRYAPANLEPFLSGQSQTHCPLLLHQRRLRSSQQPCRVATTTRDLGGNSSVGFSLQGGGQHAPGTFPAGYRPGPPVPRTQAVRPLLSTLASPSLPALQRRRSVLTSTKVRRATSRVGDPQVLVIAMQKLHSIMRPELVAPACRAPEQGSWCAPPCAALRLGSTCTAVA